jgi:phosphate transport system substrate-binding protein
MRLIMNPSAALAFALAVLAAPALSSGMRGEGAPEQFAVIVHPSTSVSDLTMAHLRRVFLGEQQFWPGGSRVVLFIEESGAVARSVVLHQLYQMNEGEFRRYWIAKTFRDDVTTGPKIVSSTALAKRLTATIPGAIAVIPADAVDGSVKVLSIDAKLPRDDAYPLAWRTP